MQATLRTVLIASATIQVRAMLSQRLMTVGKDRYRLLESDSGNETLDMCRRERPDCILLDCKLKDADGVQMARSIEETFGVNVFPIVSLTDVDAHNADAAALPDHANSVFVRDQSHWENLERAIEDAIQRVASLQIPSDGGMSHAGISAKDWPEHSEERLRLAMQVADFALAQVDYLTSTITLTKEAAKLYGLGDDETTVSRDRVHATFHPDDRDRLAALIASALNPDGPGALVTEHRIVRPDGTVLWLNVRKNIFFDRTVDPPVPTRALLVAQDVSHRKRIEYNLHLSEERLQMAAQASGVGIHDYDVATDSSVWNPEM